MVVGFAGDNPDSGVRCAVNARDYERTTNILDHLTQFSGEIPTVSRSFLVVERHPVPRLWRIVNGRCEERTDVRQAYVGDDDAYDRFRARTLEASTISDVALRLTAHELRGLQDEIAQLLARYPRHDAASTTEGDDDPSVVVTVQYQMFPNPEQDPEK